MSHKHRLGKVYKIEGSHWLCTQAHAQGLNDEHVVHARLLPVSVEDDDVLLRCRCGTFGIDVEELRLQLEAGYTWIMPNRMRPRPA